MSKALTRRLSRDPFSQMVNRVFGSQWPAQMFDLAPWGTEELSTRWDASRWMPAVDIEERHDRYVVSAELPGLSREEIEISLEDHVLTLSGERRLEEERKEASFTRVERSYGQFTRSFTLPHAVNAEKVSASFRDGVLTIDVPKAESARPRRIEIH